MDFNDNFNIIALVRIVVFAHDAAIDAFDKDTDIAVGQLDNLADFGNCADFKKVFLLRRIVLGVHLRNKKYAPIGDHCRLQCIY